MIIELMEIGGSRDVSDQLCPLLTEGALREAQGILDGYYAASVVVTDVLADTHPPQSVVAMFVDRRWLVGGQSLDVILKDDVGFCLARTVKR